MKSSTIGFICGCSAYIFWGIAPLYFYVLAEVDSFEVLGHRIVWSVIVLLGFLFYRGKIGNALALLRNWRVSKYLLMSSGLISMNWLVYIYAVATGRTIDASLGYFINPIFIVFLGVIVFKEKLSKPKKLSIFLAFLGVSYQIFALGSISWIALFLAVTFGFYGMIRKKIGVGSMQGLAVETVFAFLPACGFLLYLASFGELSFLGGLSQAGGVNWTQSVLLLSAGFVTTIPLILFAEGAKRLEYSTMGFLQYFAPTLQFLLGVFAFQEPFGRDKLIGFSLIWLGLLVLVFSEVSGGYDHHIFRRVRKKNRSSS